VKLLFSAYRQARRGRGYVQREKTKGKGAGVRKLRLTHLSSGSAWLLTASGTGKTLL